MIFEYLEAFYNTKRIHSHCDFMSPDEFERIYKRAHMGKTKATNFFTVDRLWLSHYCIRESLHTENTSHLLSFVLLFLPVIVNVVPAVFNNP